MLVNRILKHEKKSLAYQIIYRAVKKIEQKTETNPLSVLRQAIHGVTPGIAVKARRVGGSTHQVPIEIGSTQGKALAIRWLLAASRKRPGRNMAFKLSSELESGPCLSPSVADHPLGPATDHRLGAAVDWTSRGKALFRCGQRERYQIEANSEY
ncbi:hypothetical protein E3N88_18060 [Mikania micrantha]|uniref:Small ribosomal subunit protein uS7 domain-containing protein n=1 Tax=Mikania micrantha TaxID=192012 RepID=A0A5N6NU64_9ASTR|nr:hypothetical protein E3N88_18060 [Mikania micrantha]